MNYVISKILKITKLWQWLRNKLLTRIIIITEVIFTLSYKIAYTSLSSFSKMIKMQYIYIYNTHLEMHYPYKMITVAKNIFLFKVHN